MLVGIYNVSNLLCHDIYLVGLHVSLKYEIKHETFLVLTRRERKKTGLGYQVVELLLYLKTVLYINIVYNIYCVNIYIYIFSKTIYSLNEKTLIRN